MVSSSIYEKIGETSTKAHASAEDKQIERTRGVSNYYLRSTIRSSLGKRPKIDGCEKQNPNRVASSPRLCRACESKRRPQVVSNKAVTRRKSPVRRIKPVREREAVGERRTPEWLVNVMREVNGMNAKMIIEKVLTKTDIEKNEARLLIPWKKIEDMDFLREEELNIIDEHFKKLRKKGVDFTLVDSRRRQWELNFRRWDMKRTSNYVFTKGWHKVVVRNRIRRGHKLRVWSFRSQDRLFFALVPPDPAPSSPQAPVVSRVSGDLNISETVIKAQEEMERRIFIDFPRRRLRFRVPVPAPAPDRDTEGMDILAQVCEEATRLQASQDANRTSSLVSVTELDLERRL